MPCRSVATSRSALSLLATAATGAGLFAAALPARASSDDGSVLASIRTAQLDDARQIRATVLRHTLVQATGRSTDDGVWSSTWGHWGDHDANASEARLRSNGGGVMGGIDHELGDLHLGVIAGAGNLTARTTGADVQSQASVIGAYVAGQSGHWEWQGGVSYAWNQLESHRRTLQGVASARYNSGMAQAQAWADGGYRIPTAHGSITPFVNLARAQLFQDSIDEANAPNALHVNATRGHVDIGTVGVRGSMAFQDGVVGHAGIGYQRGWGDDLRPADTQRFASGGDPLQAIGVPTPRNAAVADLGIAFATSKGTAIDASYRGMFGGGSKDQGLRLSITLKW